MSGGKSKTYGKAVPRPLYQKPIQGMFQAWRAEQTFKKSLKNPLTNRSTYGIMNTSNERGKQDDY